MMMFKKEKYMPPGENLREMKLLAIICMSGYAVLSICTFLALTYRSLNDLYDSATGELLKGVRIADYRTIWDSGIIQTYWLWVLVILSYARQNYRVFHKPTKSIYTMARIRSPWELHIRCWTVPLLTALTMAAGYVLLRILFFIIYVLVTPAEVPKPGFEQLIGGLL